MLTKNKCLYSYFIREFDGRREIYLLIYKTSLQYLLRLSYNWDSVYIIESRQKYWTELAENSHKVGVLDISWEPKL